MASKKDQIKKYLKENPNFESDEVIKKFKTSKRYFRLIRQEMWESAKSSIYKTIVKKSNKRVVGIMSDIHIPYHDADSINTTITYFKAVGVTEIILLGDVCDFYKISFFKCDPSRMRLLDEVAVARKWLIDLRKEFPDHKITYVMGNHEVRLERYVADRAPELAGLYGVTLPGILGLDVIDIEFIDNVDRMVKGESPLTIGKLTLLHGHEVKASYGSVNIPRLYFTKTHANTLFGHVHKSQNYITKNIHGRIMGAWAIGCLCRLREHYMPINEWVHGFTVVRVDNETGKFSVDNKMIIDGEVL